jgi:pantothenate kinase
MGNVIQFPKTNANLSFTPDSVEKIDERMQLLKMHHIQDTLNLMIPSLFSQILTAGFELDVEEGLEDPDIKDGAFIIEAIRSFLCKKHNIDHPLQRIAENVFIREDEDIETTTFKIADRIELDLKLVDDKEEEYEGDEKGNGD